MIKNQQLKNWIQFGLAAFLIIAVVCYYVFFYLLPQYKTLHIEQKKHALEQNVNSIWSNIDFYYKSSSKGSFSSDSLKSFLTKQMQYQRYGEQVSSYFWLIDTKGNIVSHPYIDQKNEDVRAQKAIWEMLYLLKKQEHGFVEYKWEYQTGDKELDTKIAFIKLFEPWNLIVGTGCFMQEIDNDLIPIKKDLIGTSVIVICILVGILVFVFMLGRRVSNTASEYLFRYEEGQSRFETLFHQSPIPTVIYSPLGERLKVNKAWLKFFETDEKTVIGFNILDVVKEKYDPLSQKVQEAFAGRAFDMPPIEFDLSILGMQIEKKWMGFSLHPIFNNKGDIIQVVGYAVDISRMKRTDDEIRKLSESLKQSPVSVVITDLDGHIEYVNPSFEKLTQYRFEEIKGKNPRFLKSGLTTPDTYEDMWGTISKGKVWHRDILNKKKNGELIWERTTISPVRNELGDVINYVAVKEDITEQKRLQEELIQAKQKAEESDRLKSSFLANVSHEIRTPMNAIVGFSSFLIEESLDEDTRMEFCEHIKSNGDNLLNLIDDIMDISLINAGELKIRKVETNLEKILNELINAYREKNERSYKKILNFELNTESLEGLQVYTDPNRLRQVLNNLLNNAVKYTIEGKVSLTCRQVSDYVLEFEVSDTGVGIPKNKHEVIFKPFTHLDYEFVSLHGGTGLGLSITKDIVQLLGGEISLESEPDIGSKFCFSIYTGKDDDVTLEQDVDVSTFYWPGKSILIAEDEETNYQYLMAALRRKGVAICRVKNGKEAVDLYKDAQRFDLILMDLKMPVMDGKDACKHIREIDPDVPIIAQTAYVFELELDQIWDFGFTNYIAKPIKRKKMLGMIDEYLRS